MTRKEGVEGSAIALDYQLDQALVIVYAILCYNHDFLYLRCEKIATARRRNGSMIS